MRYSTRWTGTPSRRAISPTVGIDVKATDMGQFLHQVRLPGVPY
jgi:hypothetical protein